MLCKPQLVFFRWIKLALSFALSLVLITSSALGKSADCGPSNQVIKTKQDACKMMMEASGCEVFSPSEYLKTCSPDEVSRSEALNALLLLKTCHQGAVDATADFFTWVDESLTHVSSSVTGKIHLLQACDIACKRKMAKDLPEFLKMNDSEIGQINASYIEEKVRVYENDRNRYLQTERARNFDSRREFRVGNVSPIQHEKNTISLFSLIESAVKKEFLRPQCFKAEFYSEMFCYALFTIVDPVVAAGLVMKSPKLARILTKTSSLDQELNRGKKFAATKVGESRNELGREALIKSHLNTEFTTVEQNRKWIEAVESDVLPTGAKVLDVENSVMQQLNNTTKDKNLVTSMTNKHKEILKNKIKDIAQKYQAQLEFLPYSDFKSQRWLIKVKPPLKEVPAKIQKEIAAAFKKANVEFDAELKLNGVIRETDQADTWFRAGIGRTADEANMAARASRELVSNELRAFEDQGIQENLKVFLKWAEVKRKIIAKDLAGTGLIKETSRRVEIPSEAVFDAIKKNSDNASLRESLVKSYAGASKADQERLAALLTDDKLNHLREYASLTNQFSPGIRTAERKIASIQEAQLGGMTADFAGIGARNLRATAEALADASDLKEALQMARKSEMQVTHAFRREKGEFDSIVSKYMQQTIDSGDDFAATASSRMTVESKQKMLKEVAALKNPAGKRLSFIGEGVVATERNQLAAHGEAIEKILRAKLNGEIAPEKLKQVVFATDMKGKRLGQGSVQLLVGESSSASLTKLERQKIQTIFKESLREFNAKADGELASKAYTAEQ